MNLDANEYYLSKYLDKQDKQDMVQEYFKSSIATDLKNLETIIDSIMYTVEDYEAEYNMDFTEIAREYIDEITNR